METIEVTKDGFLAAIKEAMFEARVDERVKISREVEAMITENMPGGIIVALRKIRDEILANGQAHL